MNHGAPGEIDRLLSILLEGQRPSSASVDPSTTADARVVRAQAIISERRKRRDHFADALFGEPGWEMLLLLYIARARHSITAGQLCKISGAPPTTAFRWLDYLEQEGLIEKRQHHFDRRMAYVELTPGAALALDRYLSGTGVAGSAETSDAANQNSRT